MSYAERNQIILVFLWLPSFQSSSSLEHVTKFLPHILFIRSSADRHFLQPLHYCNWATVNMKASMPIPDFPCDSREWGNSLYVYGFNLLTRQTSLWDAGNKVGMAHLTQHSTPSARIFGKLNFPIFQIGKLEEKHSFHRVGPDFWSVPFSSCEEIDIDA